MQQVNDFATQQTIIYKLMESSAGLVKQNQNIMQSNVIHKELQNDLYLKKLSHQIHTLKQFDSSHAKLKQLIQQLGINYEQLQKRKSEQYLKQSQLLKIQGQTKKTEIQMKSLSFQSSKKYDYKIHLKEANQNKRKQLQLILIEEARLKQQKLIHQQIKTGNAKVLNQIKNQYTQLLKFNQQIVIQQIQAQSQVNTNLKQLNQKLQEVNRRKCQNLKLQAVLEAAKIDNQNLQINKNKTKTLKQDKQKTITDLINIKQEFSQKFQNISRLKFINEMNLIQMKLNYQSITKNNQYLKAKSIQLQKEIKMLQYESINIQTDKTSLILQNKSNNQKMLMLKQQLFDNFKYIQKYQELNRHLILQSRAIIPAVTQEQLQKMYYQRAKHYYHRNSDIFEFENKNTLFYH